MPHALASTLFFSPTAATCWYEDDTEQGVSRPVCLLGSRDKRNLLIFVSSILSSKLNSSSLASYLVCEIETIPPERGYI